MARRPDLAVALGPAVRVDEKCVAVRINEIERTERSQPGGKQPTISRRASTDGASPLTGPTVPSRSSGQQNANSESVSPTGVNGETEATFFSDARHVAVVSEYMGASAEFALEGLRITQCRFPLGRQADVREHEIARRPVLLHESHETAFRSRTRLPQQKHVVILKVCDAPAVLVGPVVTTAAGEGFQRKTDRSRIPARHCK